MICLSYNILGGSERLILCRPYQVILNNLEITARVNSHLQRITYHQQGCKALTCRNVVVKTLAAPVHIKLDATRLGAALRAQSDRAASGGLLVLVMADRRFIEAIYDYLRIP
jgi:hypothetical protein